MLLPDIKYYINILDIHKPSSQTYVTNSEWNFESCLINVKYKVYYFLIVKIQYTFAIK